MNHDRIRELAGLSPLNEMAKGDYDVEEVDFEKVKTYLKKKYGSKKDVDGMSKMELLKAAKYMPMNEMAMEYEEEDAAKAYKEMMSEMGRMLNHIDYFKDGDMAKGAKMAKSHLEKAYEAMKAHRK